MSTEKTATTSPSAANEAADVEPARDHDAEMIMGDTPQLPNNWKYRHFRVLGVNIPWYASPQIQLVMVAFVCFMCPGMFNALGGLGGGGKTNPTLADNMVSSPIHQRK